MLFAEITNIAVDGKPVIVDPSVAEAIRWAAYIMAPSLLALAGAATKFGHWIYKAADKYVDGMIASRDKLDSQMLGLVKDTGSNVTNTNRTVGDAVERLGTVAENLAVISTKLTALITAMGFEETNTGSIVRRRKGDG